MQREQDFHIAFLAVSFLHADNIKVKPIPVSKFPTPWLAEHNENLLRSKFNGCLSISTHDQVT